MSKQTQISALVSDITRARLDQFARETGLKKGFVIETALMHHLRALDELPADILIHPRVVVDRKTGKRLLARIAKPGRPTKAMKELFSE